MSMFRLAGSIPLATRRRIKAVPTNGTAAIRRPSSAARPPRAMPRSLRITRSQYVPCDCAQRSLTPSHSGNARRGACAEAPTKSTRPSRSAVIQSVNGEMSSRETSSPSWPHTPSVTAATTGTRNWRRDRGLRLAFCLWTIGVSRRHRPPPQEFTRSARSDSPRGLSICDHSA